MNPKFICWDCRGDHAGMTTSEDNGVVMCSYCGALNDTKNMDCYCSVDEKRYLTYAKPYISEEFSMKILIPEFKQREEGEQTFTEFFNSPEVLKRRQQLCDAIEAEWAEECKRADEIAIIAIQDFIDAKRRNA